MIIKAGIEYALPLTDIGAETFIDSHKDSAPAHEIDRYVQEKYRLDVIRNELSKPKNIYHIIKHEEKIAGFSKINLNVPHPAIALQYVTKMDQIYLLESFHGLRLGAKLLQHNIEYSKARKENGMWLVVWVGNTGAISFYKKFGFHVIKQDYFQLTDEHISPCYIMLLNY